jgi:hypothetical protein
MHNPTPLAAMIHLKELDRQAAPRLRPLRSRRQADSGIAAVRAAMIALLRRLHALGIPGRVASQG